MKKVLIIPLALGLIVAIINFKEVMQMKKIVVLGMIFGLLFATVGIVTGDDGKGFALSQGQGPALYQTGDLVSDMAEANTEGWPGHLFLWQKCFEGECTWDDPAEWGDNWGRLLYYTEDYNGGVPLGEDEYHFNAVIRYDDDMNEGTDYTLIYYPDINEIKLHLLCTEGCSGTWTHTMIIDSYNDDGTFSGTGYYDVNPLYTWTVTGTSLADFTLVYTGLNPGYSVTCENDVCTGPGQTFELSIEDTGNAIWPHPIAILGEGTTNEFGNVCFNGVFDFNSIPWAIDSNSPGAKIWLVLSTDVNDQNDELTGWTPSEYLFENNLID